MADPLDECPAYVKARHFQSDTLEARVPYRNVDETVVTVPKIVDAGKPFEKYIASDALALTTVSGEEPPDSPPGWNSATELGARTRLRSLATTIRVEASLYPEVRNLAERLAASAENDLRIIEQIYDDWADLYFWAAYSTNLMSCWAINKLPRPGYSGWYDIPIAGSNQTARVKIAEKWGACKMSLSQEWPYLAVNILRPRTQQEVTNGFAAVKDLLGPELMGEYDIYNAYVEDLYEAIRRAMVRDRIRIAELYRHAYKTLWCAEYGIAQGESYSKNKKLWQQRYGEMPVLVTPTQGGTRPDAVRPGLGFEAPHIPEECLLFGTNCPPPKPGGGLGEAPTPTAPGTQPIPEPVAPSKWYETVAGKIGIAVATLTVVGGAGYGIYYARQRA